MRSALAKDTLSAREKDVLHQYWLAIGGEISL